jgi:uncharacterized protein (DUF885 family)
VVGVTSEVARLADDLLAAMHERAPLLATLAGFRARDAELADLTEAGDAAAAARFAGVLARAGAVDRAGLPTADRLTLAVVDTHARAALDRVRARTVEHTVTPLYVAPAAELLVGLPMIGIDGPEHAEAYLARLSRVPALLAALADRHRAGAAAGRRPVRRLVDAAVAQLDAYLADRAGDPVRRAGDAATPAGFAAACDRLVDERVRPAFAGYREALAAEVAPGARADDRAGLCWLPGGDAGYERLARAYTTTTRTAADLHAAGLDLAERIAEEFREVGGRVLGERSVPGVFARLRADPALRWRDGAEVLAAARAAVARAELAAPGWFGRLPRAGCRVEELPAGEGPGGAPGYHVGAALDGSRPCAYLVNTDRAAERDRYAGEAVAYHEAVPGHHVQVGLARELPGLPALRRVVAIDAFGEGWALYAERLADEMGLYSDDLAYLGLLAGEALRAARLVVDTGLHAYGWDRARAVDFLLANTPLAEVDVDREVDRYLADPGQALAYMVGRLEFERLRGRARRGLGERFDLRAFHDAVLAHGELPLDALAGVVDEWISSARGGGGPDAGES